MRRIRSVLSVAMTVGVLTSVSASAAFAVDACHRPPPAWYTAPRVTYTYSTSYGAGYNHAATHEYSAQRRYYSASRSSRYHDPFARW
jgi:hypothetical protein